MDDQVEEWRPVYGHEDKYEVSSLGYVRVRKTRKYVMSGQERRVDRRTARTLAVDPAVETERRAGIPHLILKEGRKEIVVQTAVVVLQAFHGVPAKGPVPLHLDGNIYNNSAKNLRWKMPAGWRVSQ